jgi:Rieske Fe-S protein
MVNEQRRSFLRLAIHGLSALFGAILGIPAVFYLLDPRNRPASRSSFRPVSGVKLNELEVGIPMQGILRDIRRDAWTLHPDDVIGKVWVVKLNNDPSSVKVFTTICPHLGCSINFDPPGADRGFTCPCHGGKFRLNGERDPNVQRNPPGRGMDELRYQMVRDPDDPNSENRNLLLVEYLNFEPLVEVKKVRA